ncbi:hypothetical protein D9M69_427600 [compost metagenome]
MVEQRLEVLQVEQQQAFAIGHLECGVERRLLTVGQLQQVAEQQRAHLAERGAQWLPGLPGHVPQADRIGARLVVQPGHRGDAFGHLALRIAGRAEAAEVALDVGGEHRHAGVAEQLGETLQGHRLAGAGGAGHQAVTIGQFQRLGHRLACRIGAENEGLGFEHAVTP